jgi:hypothetical protein
MPREQRTSLNKTAVNEVPLGEFKSGVTKTVNMPTVAPTKSLGQSLAEGLNMVTKAATVYGQGEIDKDAKARSIEMRAKGNYAGKQEARRLYIEIRDKKIPIEQRGKFYFDGITAFNASLGDVHAGYLEGAMSAVGSRVGQYQDINDKEMTDRVDEETARNFNALFRTEVSLGATPHELLKLTRDSKMGISYDDSAKYYVINRAAIIEQNFQDDPTYDWKTAIKNELRITSADKTVDFAKHPVYGVLIDNLEDTLKVQAKSNYTSNKAAAAESKRIGQEKILEMLLDDKVDNRDVLKYHQANKKGWTSKDWKEQEKSIKLFHGNGFSDINNTAYVATVKSWIVDDNYTDTKLFEDLADKSFTEAEYKEIIAFKMKHDKETQTVKASLAKQFFKAQMSTGKHAAGMEPMFTFVKEGAERKQRYVEIMNMHLQSFVSDKGWDELTTDQITKWSRETYGIVTQGMAKTGGTTIGNDGTERYSDGPNAGKVVSKETEAVDIDPAQVQW